MNYNLERITQVGVEIHMSQNGMPGKKYSFTFDISLDT